VFQTKQIHCQCVRRKLQGLDEAEQRSSEVCRSLKEFQWRTPFDGGRNHGRELLFVCAAGQFCVSPSVRGGDSGVATLFAPESVVEHTARGQGHAERFSSHVAKRYRAAQRAFADMMRPDHDDAGAWSACGDAFARPFARACIAVTAPA
jgi:hypothetical protein